MVQNEAIIRPDVPLIDQAAHFKEIINEEQEALAADYQALDEQLLARTRARFGIDRVRTAYDRDLVDVNVDKERLLRPDVVSAILPASEASLDTTRQGRRDAAAILLGKDDRISAVIRACSIYIAEEPLEFARQYLVPWRKRFAADLNIEGGWYDEKPRTPPKKGKEEEWKGLAFDPRRDRSDDMNLGVILSRIGMLEMTKMGIPLSKERLSALTTQFQNGLTVREVSGARSTPAPWSREYGAGASAIMAFKNLLNGDISVAAGAAAGSMRRHTFAGIDMNGSAAKISAEGNALGYVLLRGHDQGPNCGPEGIAEAKAQNAEWGIFDAVGVDLSHGNSGKKASRQIDAAAITLDQVANGEETIREIWVESNLVEGRQDYVPGKEMVFGKSTTDECVGPDETLEILEMAASAVRQRRKVGHKLQPKVTA